MRNPRLMEDMEPTFPSNDIICATCRYKKNGVIGYKNRYCEKYKEGKPTDILFDNARCRFYDTE